MRKLSSIYRDSILTQLYLDVITSSLLSGFAKIAPWWLARRDSFSVNYRDPFPGGLAPPPLPANTSGPLAKIRRAKNYSASRTASNKIYHEMIPSTVLPICTAMLNMYFQTLCFG